MSKISSGLIPRAMQSGINKIFETGTKEWAPIYPKLFSVSSSTKGYEIDLHMEGFGLATEKKEGDDITFDTRRQGFSPKYIHTAYAKGFIFTREANDDKQYDLGFKGARSLQRAMQVTKEVRAHVLYNTAFSTSSAMNGGDGVAMVSTAHINGPSGGTYSNRLAVDADFSEASLEDMLKLIMRAKDDRGLPIRLMAKRLISHTDQVLDFERVLKSNLRSGTAENDLNAVKALNSIPDYVVSPYLDANTKSWFILTDAEEGMKFFDRVGIQYEEDTSFTSGDYRHKAYMRFSSGYSNPRGVYGSQGQ